MATLKNAAQLKANLNGNRTQNDLKVSTTQLKEKEIVGKKNSVESLKIEKVTTIKEPVLKKPVDLAKGVRVSLNDKRFVDFSANNKITKLEFNLHGLSRDDARNLFNSLNERLRNIDASIEMRAMAAFRRIMENREYLDYAGPKTGLDLLVSPLGGIDCGYIVTTEGRYSYRLLKKKNIILVKKNITTVKTNNLLSNNRVAIVSGEQYKDWEEIDKVENVYLNSGHGFICNDKDVKEGFRYSYCLELKNENNGLISYYEKEILYEKLIIKASFSAKPDPYEKRVCLYCNVENYSELKIYRKDNGKDLTDALEDKNVALGGRYEYVLEASNYWDPVKLTAKVDCSGLNPVLVDKNISYVLEKFDKGVSLSWTSAKSDYKCVIKRKKEKSTSWENIYESRISDTSRSDHLYKDISSSLEKGAVYNYVIYCSNGWGEDASNVISILMDNSVPQRPRLLPTSDKLLFTWVKDDLAKEYVIYRYDDSLMKNLNNITYNKMISMPKYAPSYRAVDISKNVLYTYKIVARNGWGDSEPCYYDVFDNVKGNLDGYLNNSYFYNGQLEKIDTEWTDDFQGITTDGKYWYLTNGSGYAALRKFSVRDSMRRKTPNFHLSGIAGAKPKGYDNKKTFNGEVSYWLIEDNGCTLFYTEYAKHFGDLSYYKNYLFIPAYDGKLACGEIWIVDSVSLELKHREPLKDRFGNCLSDLGWCAINPCDGRLYTTNGALNGFLYSYRININNIGSAKNVFEFAQTVSLYDEKGSVFPIKSCMQGGCFDYYNNIYLNSGYYETERRPNEGVHVFKLIPDRSVVVDKINASETTDSGKTKEYERFLSGDLQVPIENTKGVLISYSTREHTDSNNNFVYQVSHGAVSYPTSVKDFFGIFVGDPWEGKIEVIGEEPEGLVYYDFKSENGAWRPYSSATYQSSLHISLLDNELDKGCIDINDQLYMKEYLHTYRETEQKSIFYRPLNLKVVAGDSNNDWKVVDGGTLVRKFKSSSVAKNAVKILKYFDRIHTIGWLYTSSPNHNYEFSVGLNYSGSVPDYGQKKITYDGKQFNSIKEDNLYKAGDERCVVRLNALDGRNYYFLAHNLQDARKIVDLLKNYNKICYIGVGPDSDGRIRSDYNLIWLEK